MNSLTKEQKQRVYAMYAGCRILYPSDAGPGERQTWEPGKFSWSVVAGTHYGVENTRLELKSLSAISDEDAVWVATLCCAVSMAPGGTIWLGKAIVTHYFSNISAWDDSEHDTAVNRNKVVGLDVRTDIVHQFLVERGYAVPLLVLGGLSPIEAGLAVDAASLPK